MKKTSEKRWFEMPDDIVVKEGAEPISWLEFEETTILDGKYFVREIRNEEKELIDIAEVFKTGFPVIKDTEFDILFESWGVKLLLGGDENFNRGDNFGVITERVEDGKIVSCCFSRMWKKQRNVEILITASHKDLKDAVAEDMISLKDKYFEKCGVEMVYIWVAAEHYASQLILRGLNYKFLGVVPGFFRIWTGKNENGKDVYKRTIEIFAQKFFHGAEKMSTRHLKLLKEAKDVLVPWWDEK